MKPNHRGNHTTSFSSNPGKDISTLSVLMGDSSEAFNPEAFKVDLLPRFALGSEGRFITASGEIILCRYVRFESALGLSMRPVGVVGDGSRWFVQEGNPNGRAIGISLGRGPKGAGVHGWVAVQGILEFPDALGLTVGLPVYSGATADFHQTVAEGDSPVGIMLSGNRLFVSIDLNTEWVYEQIAAGGGGAVGIEEAPADGTSYVRQDAGWVPIPAPEADTVNSTTITDIVSLTQVEYDALGAVDPATLYVITPEGAPA